MLRNRSENFDVRIQAMFLLEQLGGSDVRELFQELVQQDPRSEEEGMLLRTMKGSRILKQAR